MARTVQEVMTPGPVTMAAGFRLNDAAKRMKDRNIGDVIVLDGAVVCGVVTDRDIVVRAVAEGLDPKSTTLGDICSRELVTVAPHDSVKDAVKLMREHALRRLVVLDGYNPVGIVSIGDLAIERDAGSALAEISSAAPNT
jgi:CBS domain-containing protein